MVRWLGAIAVPLLVTAAAHAEPPDGPPAVRAAIDEPACIAAVSATAMAPDSDAEDRAFVAELESFARRKEFTERMVARRNTELFEQAIARQARAAKLQRELTERERARAEREFEDALALYLRKRELARGRSAAGGDAANAPAASSPSSSPRPSGTGAD